MPVFFDFLQVYFPNIRNPPNMLCTFYKRLISLAGLPAISVPAGLSKNNKPLGLQLISNKFKEDILLRAAFSLEEAASFNFSPQMEL